MKQRKILQIPTFSSHVRREILRKFHDVLMITQKINKREEKIISRAKLQTINLSCCQWNCTIKARSEEKTLF